MKNAAKRGTAAVSVIYKEIHLQCLFTDNAENTHSKYGSVIVLKFSNIILDNVNIAGNNCRGLYLFDSIVTINQTVIISNNHAVGASGGGFYIDCALHNYYKLKPLLDAYQGPYKNKVHYWTATACLSDYPVSQCYQCNWQLSCQFVL